MDGRKMAILPFKLWEDMKRWKERGTNSKT